MAISDSEAPQAVAVAASPDTIQAKFDLGIAVALSTWPALTVAVQNQWGGPDSSDKRDWLAGAISDLFTTRPDTDAEDVETMLLQVMIDEFDVNVDDESGFPIARLIMDLRKETLQGDFAEVDRMYAAWVERRGKSEKIKVQVVDNSGDDTDWDSVDEEDDDEDDDVEMGEASAPPPPKEKPAPEVDDDGFTKVVGRKKR
ncbi:MAG: hypothetical protein M1819_003334 [Sarea resinae]|nr:MAG: hypothetical protein M1819_003334 [Sarea resinae]